MHISIFIYPFDFTFPVFFFYFNFYPALSSEKRANGFNIVVLKEYFRAFNDEKYLFIYAEWFSNRKNDI